MCLVVCVWKPASLKSSHVLFMQQWLLTDLVIMTGELKINFNEAMLG